MNFIFISPHFPPNFENFVIKLNRRGIRVLGIADVNYYELSDALRENLTEYYKVDSLENYSEVVRACGYFTHKYGKIDRIESFNEHWLELDAALRTDFNVFGLNNEDIKSVKRKSKMKEVFKKAGMNVARGKVFKDEKEAKKLVKEYGYPVCIKPDIGVGAGNTYKISSDDDLKDFFNKNHDDEFIMEEFIDGDIVTYDGLIDKDGNTVFNSTLIYNMAVLDLLRNNENIYYYIPREIPEDIVEAGEKIVKAFNLREIFFHIEFFREKKTDKLIALEINCRVPGGRTTDMFNYANDIDIYDLYANLISEDCIETEITRPYYCCYVGRKSIRDFTYSIDEIKEKYKEEIMLVDSIPGIFAAVMGDIGIIFRTKEQEDLEKIISNMLEERGV
ncbi:MAG: ATP-grasp domain-containing protein [Tissierellia bacterium]|nr:ATP-grasp domain-containing protein [Tissierellia bacterium]